MKKYIQQAAFCIPGKIHFCECGKSSHASNNNIYLLRDMEQSTMANFCLYLFPRNESHFR